MQADLFDLAEEIVPMPFFDIALDSLDAKRSVAVKYPDENKKATTVGVLDNGIEPIDQLKPWIEGRRIYDGITQKLDEFNFWHSNIKVSEYISITN